MDNLIARVAGRVMTTASADVALKGLGHLLEAVAKAYAAGQPISWPKLLRPGSGVPA